MTSQRRRPNSTSGKKKKKERENSLIRVDMLFIGGEAMLMFVNKIT